MKNILSFGELLLRFSPDVAGDWMQQHSIPVFVGGAELNVASDLARWNVPVSFCTALPDHELSREVLSYLEEKGIRTNKIHFSGSRMGTLYLPQGADLKSGGVIYDRAYSSFWELTPGQMDWNKILQGIDWLHFTAISPALNENVAAVCLEAAKAASEKNITVSVDLNYRAQLWNWGREPQEVMPLLAEHCDVIMGNIWAAGQMLKTPVDAAIHTDATTEKYVAHANETAVAIMKKFPGCKAVANTFRLDSDRIRYFSSLNTNGKQFTSKEYTCDSVVDRAGSGDCYMAGLIYGMTNGLSPQETVEYATAAAFGKLQEWGESTSQTVETVYQTIKAGAVETEAGV